MAEKILVVEDDRTLLETLEYNLARQEYEVLKATDGPSALRVARRDQPDLVVLDLMLPGLDGLEVCKRIRSERNTPIIILSARGEELDKVLGLELGADDYVTKPFSPRELAARVRAVLRRMPGERGPDSISYGNLTVDFLRHEAFLDGRPLNLTPVEFKIVGVMAREPGRVFSRAQIIENALGIDFDGFDRTIDVHILKLRRKLEPDPRHPRYIKTVYGAGYKLLEHTDVAQP